MPGQISFAQQLPNFHSTAKWDKIQAITESAVLLHNRNDFLPIQKLQIWKMASISIGDTTETPFQQMLSLYSDVPHFQLGEKDSLANFDTLVKC